MIINYRLDKIAIQKKEQAKGTIEAKNNLQVTHISEEALSSLTKEKALNMKFVFSVVYQPNIASLEIEGNVTYMNDSKTIKEILENWTKNKKIKPEIAAPIFNFILSKCNIKALRLEEDLELPFHVPIPRIKTKKEITNATSAS